MDKLIESLSPLEVKIIPFLNLPIDVIIEKSQLDKTSVLRALKFLENKKLLEIKIKKQTTIDLDTNGIHYKKNHLPERQLLLSIEEKPISLEEAKKKSKLSENEFKAALGILKNKALIQLQNKKIKTIANKSDLSKKFLEEDFLETLPRSLDSLKPEEKFAFKNLQNRKDILETKQESQTSFQLTQEGIQIAGKKIKTNFIEEVTPEIIKSPGIKKFRRYDIQSPVPKIQGGKKHFVNQSIEYAKRVWLDLGFKEISGNLVDTSFWHFDALFTPQDHPARDMQDTFFLKDTSGELPEKNLVNNVKKAHETGVDSSKGWQYSWRESEAKKLILRTHTTGLSAKILANLKPQDLPAKFFVIGKVFRNETLDWSHGFEFYQSEGIVVDGKANFRHLLGFLKTFYQKMGFNQIRFRPSYFAYTEPSVEIEVFHPEKKIWLELGGAGIFRPEVVIPLLGKNIPVLAWGQGFDRIIMDFYKIKDLREMYSNDLKYIRNKPAWTK